MLGPSVEKADNKSLLSEDLPKEPSLLIGCDTLRQLQEIFATHCRIYNLMVSQPQLLPFTILLSFEVMKCFFLYCIDLGLQFLNLRSEILDL